MRIIFMGTPEFSVGILKHLFEAEQNNILQLCAVVTRPDKPFGRSQKKAPSPLKEYLIRSKRQDLLMETARVKDSEQVCRLRELQADLIVVAAFGQILSQEVLDLATYGCINVHTSLLPLYRGAAPIQRAILNGDDCTGVTIMQMVRELDAGAIMTQRTCEILPSDNAASLEKKLVDLSKEPLLEVIVRLSKGNPVLREEQDESKVSWAAKIDKTELKIDWKCDAQDIHNQIRAFDPRPGAWSYFEDERGLKRIKLRQSRVSSKLFAQVECGAIYTENDEVFVKTNSQWLCIGEVKPEGKGWMSFSAFLRGSKGNYQLV